MPLCIHCRRSKSLGLTINFPADLEPSDELLRIAREAAEATLRDVLDLQAKVRELQSRGTDLSLTELLRKKHRGRAASAKSAPTSVPLTRTRQTPAEKKEPPPHSRPAQAPGRPHPPAQVRGRSDTPV